MRTRVLLSPLGMDAVAALLVVGAVAAAPRPAAPRGTPGPDTPESRRDLERVRALYLTAVADPRAIEQGLREIRMLRAHLLPAPGSWTDAALRAYHGALVTLRAKHAVWPPSRLRHLREGLAVLDEVVARHPAHVEARYLRLMSCYYLPGILGRSGSVREDFDALGRLLPAAREAYPAELYSSMVRFLLEQGRLANEARAPLEAALALADE